MSSWPKPAVESPAELEDLVAAVLQAGQPSFQTFCSLGERYEATFQWVVRAYDVQAGQHFDRYVIQQLAELHAALDLDLYAFGQEED